MHGIDANCGINVEKQCENDDIRKFYLYDRLQYIIYILMVRADKNVNDHILDIR